MKLTVGDPCLPGSGWAEQVPPTKAVLLPQEVTIVPPTGLSSSASSSLSLSLTKLRADFICSTNCAAFFPLLEAN